MICGICGGEVVWMGELCSLTYAKCTDCGAINSQQTTREETPDEEDDEWAPRT